eukprot:270334_1
MLRSIVLRRAVTSCARSTSRHCVFIIHLRLQSNHSNPMEHGTPKSAIRVLPCTSKAAFSTKTLPVMETTSAWVGNVIKTELYADLLGAVPSDLVHRTGTQYDDVHLTILENVLNCPHLML